MESKSDTSAFHVFHLYLELKSNPSIALRPLKSKLRSLKSPERSISDKSFFNFRQGLAVLNLSP